MYLQFMDKEFLQQTFASISPAYDRHNRIFTFGLDNRWRQKAARLLLSSNPVQILDLCAGTGEMTALLCKLAPPQCQIVAADFSAPMLALAKQKLARCPQAHRVSFVEADAAALPFAHHSFDACCVAFGMRNLTFCHPNAKQHLLELARVTAPKGRLIVLETGQPRSAFLRVGNRVYLRLVVGPLGGWLSKDPKAYSYLARSAGAFSHTGAFADDLIKSGFARVEHTPLLGGVAGITVATC